MRLAYAIDHDNHLMYYDPDFIDILPNIKYKKIKTKAFTTSTRNTSTIKSPELLLFVSSVDQLLLYSNEWLGTHPNGLLLQPSTLFTTANASMGFIFKKFGLTAWHNVMIAPHKDSESPNVPMISLFDSRQWHVNILTTPAILTSIKKSDNSTKLVLQLDYDVALVENPHEYPAIYPSVLGREVCAYGIISAILPLKDGIITLASYLPEIFNLKPGCPKLTKGMEVTLASAYSGIRNGEVTSLHTTIAYFIEPKYIVEVQEGFKINAPSMPGDSGGAVYIDNL